MVIQTVCNFTDNMKTPTVSKIFPNAQGDVLSLQISGSINQKIFIESRNNAKGDWVPLAGINLSDFSVAREYFSKAGLYEIGIVSARDLRLRLETAPNGSFSVVGQVISTEET